MNHPAVKYRALTKYSTWDLKSYGMAMLALAIMAGVFLTLGNMLTPNHLLVAATFFGLGALGLTLNLAEAAQRKRALSQFARRTKLNWEMIIGSSFFGYPMRLSGSYRGRAVTLHPRQAYGRSSATHLELSVENLVDASLRLRGPFHGSIMADQVTVDLLSASGMRPVGAEKLFFIGGSPVHVTTNLLASNSLQAALESLPQPLNVELREQKLYLTYRGLVNEAKQVTILLDILSDLADTVEQKSSARQRMLSAKAKQPV